MLKMVKRIGIEIERLYLYIVSKFKNQQKKAHLQKLYANLDLSILKFLLEGDPSKVTIG